MRFTEIQEGAYERAADKKVRLNKLYNERASLRDELRKAREEQDEKRASEIETKLGRLSDTIEALSESVSPKAALKAKLQKMKADYDELPKNPGSQEGYDALDDMQDEIKKLEHKLSTLTEADDADATYEFARGRALKAIAQLQSQIDQFTKAQKKNSRDWGYAGTMGSIATRLEELTEFFGN
jgi:chromosome segregation ATPase